ncbi:MAG: prepilin-type N-terminal cleavage/methylation domain-containing protein [Gammaproteobacteria bacterium]|nr:prepilin-type N-terminal cleavage/methylation domain-containing protein [Gammaproteobacteria bacterium]
MRNVPISLPAKGFTLTEVLLVIMIIGVVAVTALPEFSSRDTAKLDLTAAEVADAFRFARHESIRTGLSRGLKVNETNEAVRVFRLDFAVNPPNQIYDVYHPVAKNLYDTQADWRLPRGVTVITSNFSFAGACNKQLNLAFDSRGMPTCIDPVTVRLQSATVTLELDGETRAVNIAPITGRVTVQ